MYHLSPPSPVHEADDVDHVGVVGVWHDDRVKADVLAEEGSEDVEDVPVDIPHGPLGPDGAAEEGELGHMVGPPLVAEVVVDVTEVLRRRRRRRRRWRRRGRRRRRRRRRRREHLDSD